MMQVFDNRRCELGEGPMWHPKRAQLFWFDITNKKLMSRVGEQALDWPMPERVSAAGWVDHDTLILFGESGYYRFDLTTGACLRLGALEADNRTTRSNDGRADPFGGFWIGTMGLSDQKGAGAIYRYYRGEVRQLFPNLSIPNAICFSPDTTTAYFADTEAQLVWHVALDDTGWPKAEPEVFLDTRGTDIYPDGAVITEDGHFWNAQWGGGRVAEYDAAGTFLRAISLPAPHSTCPSFGGPDLSTLYCTSAMQGRTEADRAANPAHGQTFVLAGVSKGRAEPAVVL